MGLELTFFSTKSNKDIEEFYIETENDFDIIEDELDEVGYLGRIGSEVLHNIYDWDLRNKSEFFVEITDFIEECFMLNEDYFDDDEMEILYNLRDDLLDLAGNGYRIFVEISY